MCPISYWSFTPINLTIFSKIINAVLEIQKKLFHLHFFFHSCRKCKLIKGKYNSVMFFLNYFHKLKCDFNTSLPFVSGDFQADDHCVCLSLANAVTIDSLKSCDSFSEWTRRVSGWYVGTQKGSCRHRAWPRDVTHESRVKKGCLLMERHRGTTAGGR